MTKFAILPLACMMMATPLAAQTPAKAEAGTQTAAPVVRTNDMIVSADGRRVGRVDAVRGDAALVIYNGRFVSIPTASLAADGKRLKTSLKMTEILHR